MSFAGAVIDGPYFGQKRNCRYPEFNVAVSPTLGYLNDDHSSGSLVSVVRYKWMIVAGCWSCGQPEDSERGDLKPTLRTRTKYARRKRRLA